MKNETLVSQFENRLQGKTPELMNSRGKFAVLVPLVERQGELSLLYEVRSLSLKKQPGDICFPGGRVEQGESVLDCVLRETREELGIPEQAVDVIGETDFIALRNGCSMHPVLGIVDEAAASSMTLNPDEVSETFFVPLSHLVSHPPQEYTGLFSMLPPEDFPYERFGISRDYGWMKSRETVQFYSYESHVIWGLTGKITKHILELLEK